ncbi:uncharacterized protein LOC119669110 [Teleopsis dalmanni]|uniref:uncharacterized protein LOC119668323 n=1 Tax=Teleopsis dalmanni TaxID=139649 RepID=UPI0018CE6EEC|nr:uncharacterized protein LOC119668323 [Teleopsis dalmanni]XP_037934819.1 uncharacterized protein LOC119669110 [Teleopsis dalmanni]
MAQNFLYMFEFVVDDLLITRPNCCAPEEYPTCCEISFRSSVFVNICDREFGQCVDMCAPKLGKCCLFSLESPVTDKDRLLIHIYKKKTEKCKFLIGATDLAIKTLFDKVTENFNIDNPNWEESLKHTEPMPDFKKGKGNDGGEENGGGGKPRSSNVVDNDCEDEDMGRREQFCPASELTKRLLPLFNMKGAQTGNIVLIMRLVCNGPAIVSSFPFSRFCSKPCDPCKKPPKSAKNCKEPPPNPLDAICKKPEKKAPPVRRYFGCNAEKGCPFDECEDYCDRGEIECPKPCTPKKQKAAPCNVPSSSSGCSDQCPQACPQQRPKGRQTSCCPEEDTQACTCCCTCDECLDECEAGGEEEESSESDPCLPKPKCPKPKPKPKCTCIKPCFINPTKPDPGPEAYDEFEACLNGSGLTIRVLKDTHQVESVNDGEDEGLDDSGSECDKPKSSSNCDLNQLLQKSSFARKYVKRRTGGFIHNNPKIPKIRANIRYAGDDFCCPGDYHVPCTKIKEICDNRDNKVEQYRKNTGDNCPTIPALKPTDTRNCCLQVNPQEIQKTLKGINYDVNKKGIEVCYKTCEDTDSDVFLVKLGSKQKSRNKKNTIEIELKTPKQPFVMPVRTVTTETQIREAELDAELKGVCGKKKKGKKGKKKKKK